MKISLINAGKRFNREWIFRNIDYTFSSGQSYAITGPNGSGKSTLLLSIGGALQLSEGDVRIETSDALKKKNTGALTDDFHACISIAAPYLELIEEYTLSEFLRFHQRFKPFLGDLSTEKIMDLMQMTPYRNKQLRIFSSGMKQRVKLAQAIFSDVPVVLLDEPCTNLDQEGIRQYHWMAETYCKDRMIVISSNEPAEYAFCSHTLHLPDLRK